eukprot:5126480-Heterocapsa_arctica.AAC.1
MFAGLVKRVCPITKTSAGQSDCVDRMRRAVASMGPPPNDLDGPGALRALRVKQGYAGDSAILASLSPDNIDRVSLPSPGDSSVSLETLGGGAGRKLVDRLLSKLLPEDQAREKQLRTAPRQSYSDPALSNNPRLYAAF